MLKAVNIAIGAALAGSTLMAGHASAQNYTYTAISVPNSTTYAQSINDTGVVVGHAIDNTTQANHGFTVQGGSYFFFNAPAGARFIVPSDINDKGLVIATDSPSPHKLNAFTYNSVSGRKTTLVLPNSSYVQGTALNRSGVVVGNTYLPGRSLPHGFLTQNGVTTIIDPPGSVATFGTDIADDGTMTGRYGNAANHQLGYTYKAGTYTDIDVPGSQGLLVTSINSQHVVTGVYADSSGNDLGFTAHGNHIVSYSFPGAISTTVMRALPGGAVLGNWTDGSGNSHGFHYLGGIYFNIDYPGAVSTNIIEVNANGDFVGDYANADGTGAGFSAICPAGTGPCRQ